MPSCGNVSSKNMSCTLINGLERRHSALLRSMDSNQGTKQYSFVPCSSTVNSKSIISLVPCLYKKLSCKGYHRTLDYLVQFEDHDPYMLFMLLLRQQFIRFRGDPLNVMLGEKWRVMPSHENLLFQETGWCPPAMVELPVHWLWPTANVKFVLYGYLSEGDGVPRRRQWVYRSEDYEFWAITRAFKPVVQLAANHEYIHTDDDVFIRFELEASGHHVCTTIMNTDTRLRDWRVKILEQMQLPLAVEAKFSIPDKSYLAKLICLPSDKNDWPICSFFTEELALPIVEEGDTDVETESSDIEMVPVVAPATVADLPREPVARFTANLRRLGHIEFDVDE